MSNSIDLKNMLGNNDEYVDNTDKIRNLKHSSLIRQNIKDISLLRSKHFDLFKNNIEEFKSICNKKNSFLFNNYFDIFNKVAANEIDLNMMDKFLNILTQIENNSIDQHEGSIMIGEILKRIYIDSAIKKGEKLDNINKKEKIINKEPINISWKQYKNKFTS
tara:strand:- start:888 stop:1373 length:486 start_codon:yes stop_codon:yes gene_type:complete